MSDEESKDTPAVAVPAWVNSQPAKESTPPKAKRTRRTKAQMAEARASTPPVAGVVVAVDDHTVAPAPEEKSMAYTPKSYAATYLPIVISLIALACAVHAHLR